MIEQMFAVNPTAAKIMVASRSSRRLAILTGLFFALAEQISEDGTALLEDLVTLMFFGAFGCLGDQRDRAQLRGVINIIRMLTEVA